LVKYIILPANLQIGQTLNGNTIIMNNMSYLLEMDYSLQ